MMNFDKLPCDIKRMIFDCNREAAQIENNKKRYDEVMQELPQHGPGEEYEKEINILQMIYGPTFIHETNHRSVSSLILENIVDMREWDYGEIDVAAEYREMVRE